MYTIPVLATFRFNLAALLFFTVFCLSRIESRPSSISAKRASCSPPSSGDFPRAMQFWTMLGIRNHKGSLNVTANSTPREIRGGISSSTVLTTRPECAIFCHPLNYGVRYAGELSVCSCMQHPAGPCLAFDTFWYPILSMTSAATRRLALPPTRHTAARSHSS